MKIGDRVKVLNYFAPYLIGEIGIVTGFAPVTRHVYVTMENAEYLQLKYHKVILPEDLEIVS